LFSNSYCNSPVILGDSINFYLSIGIYKFDEDLKFFDEFLTASKNLEIAPKLNLDNFLLIFISLLFSSDIG